jgi:hypothetical protein
VNKFGGMEIDDLSLNHQQQVMDLSFVMDAIVTQRAT